MATSAGPILRRPLELASFFRANGFSFVTADLRHLFDLPRAELSQLLASWGFASVHAVRLWRYLYRELTTDFATMVELPRRLRERLAVETSLALPTVAATSSSDEGATSKYLLELDSQSKIETVLMRYARRATACLSSQAGCALGCVFCATGQAGFTRNLSTAEIVGQALLVERELRAADASSRMSQTRRRALLGNLVFMGMGEPLLNYEAVMRAIEILGDSAGFAIGGKQTTLSTVGIVPGIVRLADERRPFSLAVSLHAATQEERAAIVPAARAWPLEAVIEACRYYATKLSAAKLDRKIFFEWTLIAGKNDGPEQARRLVEMLRGIPAQINVIPLNATAGYDGIAGSVEAARRFQAWLRAAGLPTTIRRHRGLDVAGGCGQLAGAT
ncbi:MAG: 23S rRNA (adenine(2503)-C(2))-methyltransferase RlmN [Planctomycetia bacterium]|nr:23S rRNA (adenine(2503)-C(2))-methyltransferase RlmN [Planctomycetia bacterium]